MKNFFLYLLILCFYSSAHALLEPLTEVFCLAQTALWLNDTTLAVGKWDGTLTIFNFNETLTLAQVLTPPHKEGVTAIEKLDHDCFISSDGPSTLAFWIKEKKEGYRLHASYCFDETYGSIDSALFHKAAATPQLITGHSNGYLLIWSYLNHTLHLENVIDLRSNQPIDSPYPLLNIRKIVPWKNGIVITGSEEGDLCMVDCNSCQLLYRQRYNPNAKRGINDLAISNDLLLLANCSLGPSDQNLWLYRIEKDRFIYLDATHLIADRSRQQVFNFNVALLSNQNNTYFLSSTGENLIWHGVIENESFKKMKFQKNSLNGGAVLAVHPSKKYCASINYNVKILKITVDEFR